MGNRSNRWWAAYGTAGSVYLPLIMVDSGHQISNGYLDFHTIYRGLIDSELLRPPQAHLEGHSWRAGERIRFHGQVTNLSGVTLSSANSAAIHAIVYEDAHVGVTSRIVRAAPSLTLTSDLEDGEVMNFSLETPDLIGVDWDKLHTLVFVEYRPGISSGPYDMLQAAVMSGFTDVPGDYWAYNHIMAIYNAGYTTGTGTGTFSPESSVTREQMAAFIVRAKEGEPASNYCSTGSAFPDVTAADWSCGYIKRLYELGLTTGYGTTGYFMPSYAVTREQMAAFLIRAIEGNPASNYCDSGSPFTDVTAADWSCIYIKRLYELGITTGYGDGTYGPYDLVTRAQMAVFLGRAFLGME